VLADPLEDRVRAALAVADDDSEPPAQRAEMLMEIAIGLQQRPRTRDYLAGAVTLYQRALSLCPDDQLLLRARITARKASVLQVIPEEGTASLELALAAYDDALPVLAELGRREERAELEMNRGLVLHALAGAGRARITDAIAAYQRALTIFDAKRHPIEFALLQSNLATAFLATPVADERGKIREALAVQAFEEALKVLNLVDHPVEYAMLQNNLGNALQYASTTHVVENNLRALGAYDEALKVRTRTTSPIEYANTIANKANCLRNLPDDVRQPEKGNHANLRQARSLYVEARAVFADHGETARARIIAEALLEIAHQDLAQDA
jgi:tetratricopeptide (TPR) repeat protein